MFQFVRKDANEAIVVDGLTVEVSFSVLSEEKNCLHRPSAAVCLDPPFVRSG
jgi:hypothetical protein